MSLLEEGVCSSTGEEGMQCRRRPTNKKKNTQSDRSAEDCVFWTGCRIRAAGSESDRAELTEVGL